MKIGLETLKKSNTLNKEIVNFLTDCKNLQFLHHSDFN